MNTLILARFKKYRNQFMSITGLTVVMLFGFQNCAKVTAELSSTNNPIAINAKGLSLTSSQISLGDSSIPIQVVAAQDESQVHTQIICDLAGMYVDPVQGKCPEGSEQIGGDAGSPVTLTLPNQNVELAINAVDAKMVDLGECLTEQMIQMLAKNPSLRILLYVAANNQVNMSSLINGWMDTRVNSLTDSNGVLLNAEVRKDILSRYRVAVQSLQDSGFDGVVNSYILQKFFTLPASQVLKVTSLVHFEKQNLSEQCVGASSIRPELRLQIHFQGLASNLKIHLQHLDQSITSLQNFSVQVNPSSADPDDKILSIDLEELVGVKQLTLEYTP